jgi:hypothetical protein
MILLQTKERGPLGKARQEPQGLRLFGFGYWGLAAKEAAADHSYYDCDCEDYCEDYCGTGCGCDLDHRDFDSDRDRACCTTAEGEVEVEDVHVHAHVHVRSTQSANVREHGAVEAVRKAHHWKAAAVVADKHLN